MRGTANKQGSKNTFKLTNFNRRGGSLKLVFVSACQSSSIATCFVSAGIPHVIAVDSNTFILDNIARTFAETFYSSLIAGGSVESAYEVARDRSMLENRHSETNVGEDVTKQFLLLGEGDHSEVMFPAEEVRIIWKRKSTEGSVTIR